MHGGCFRGIYGVIRAYLGACKGCLGLFGGVQGVSRMYIGGLQRVMS